MPWQPVPRDQVLETCRLDPDALEAADQLLNTPWAVIRYGKLCHQYMAAGMAPGQAWSATKTLGALVTGMVAYATRNVPRTGRKTGPVSDEDRVDHWLDDFSYNQDAHIAHVLAMVAQSASLAHGEKTMEYDTLGTVQLNSLSDVLNTAIAQDPERLGTDLDQFIQRFLFDKLGMVHSTWMPGEATKLFGFSWSTDVYDMAKIGLLMLRGGVWNAERLLSAEWVYRMTHPAFEDANTGYGYATWLNASYGHSVGMPQVPELPVGPINPGPCAPVAVYKEHPHGLSEAQDCGYVFPYSCDQEHDVGVWNAVGLLGQVIQGHPALDLVVVGKDLTVEESQAGTQVSATGKLWDALRPAVVQGDPVFRGDEAAFCAAYGSNAYAPDLAQP